MQPPQFFGGHQPYGGGYLPMHEASSSTSSLVPLRAPTAQGGLPPSPPLMPKGRDISRNDIEDGDSLEQEDSEDQDSLLARLMKEGDPLNDKFQMTTAAVIMACTVSMAIETDYGGDEYEVYWTCWNNLILIYFCVELGIRISYLKWHFFACCGNKECAWNYFDTFIVMICIVDQWIQPMLPQSTDSGDSQGIGVLRIFRVFRILRTLRVLRIFKACTQLNNLAVGLLDSIGTVFWIALLMLMFMLIFAIVLTDIAGNQARVAEKEGDLFYANKEEILIYWGSVTKSLITLFQFLTLDNWTAVSRQVFDELPMMWFVFFLYVFLMGFAMLSLLTGVVAEHMTEVSQDMKKQQKENEDQALEEFLEHKMKKLELKSMDATPSSPGGYAQMRSPDRGMTLKEFETFLKYDEVKKKLKELDASLAEHEANDFWNCLDRNGDGELSHEELKRGLLRLRGELEPKDMLRIRYAAERIMRRLRGGQGEAATMRKLEEISSNLNAVEDKMKSMQGQLRQFMHHVRHRGAAPTRSRREGWNACMYRPCKSARARLRAGRAAASGSDREMRRAALPGPAAQASRRGTALAAE
eukprot:CAMPEP_0170227306 /NCGR_PEP_ID=MMETSP0116_2-20130129/13367_1 /TAXON_ID=400756 /ORGANISM="Durinskia baltica, Strain CSIRO CS-38" /LENGTH=582 /DNA_ID=CAMNT_0010478037 /DNA_START=21 /DNA_END=1767 /DNA_ORIENTATION=+